MGDERPRQLDRARLVGNRDQRPADLDDILSHRRSPSIPPRLLRRDSTVWEGRETPRRENGRRRGARRIIAVPGPAGSGLTVRAPPGYSQAALVLSLSKDAPERTTIAVNWIILRDAALRAASSG
jgi:hypothetical protein